MRLSVEHTTRYHFDPPRARVIQSHRLRPVSTAGQQVIRWDVSAPGAIFGAGFRDGAGDLVETMTVHGPVTEIDVQVSGVVETTDTSGVLRGHRETVAPSVYLRRTRTTAPAEGLRALAERLSPKAIGTLEGAHELSALVADTIEYTPGSTHAQMTAAEVLEQGQGVCQDQAQVIIAMSRLLGHPARYVTGYLFADADGNTHEASHGWAEIYIKDLGWVGFDAANRCCPDERYIRIGSGLDAQDAAPIKGISLGMGAEKMDISVNVAAQQ